MVEKCSTDIMSNLCGNHNRIILYLTHTASIIICILSIIKTGNSYVPVRIGTSEEDIEKIAYMSKAKLIISDVKYFKKTNTILYNREKEKYANIQQASFYQYQDRDEVYVLFTSGSTGTPKGVSVTYKNLMYIINNMIEISKCTYQSVYVFSTPYTFDVSVTEIYSFLYGAKTYVVDLAEYHEYKLFPQIVYENGLTHLAISPSGLKNMIYAYSNEELNQMFSSLKCIMVAGEAFKKEILDYWEDNHIACRMLNLYGPTEATVYATGYEFKHGENYEKGIPIGRALKGCTYLIDGADDDGVGELLLGGLGIANGYINNEVESKKRFMNKNGAMYYRTGDLVSIREGLLYFHGRNDDQVQLNGIRVELGEIENKLVELKGIKEAVVTYLNNMLFATVCLEAGIRMDSMELKNRLEEKVPRYMIPNVFRFVNKIELNTSNKVDRKKIECEILNELKNRKKNYEEKGIDYKCILNLMQQCLGSDNLLNSIDDDFFECGGDSLRSFSLLNEIEKICHKEFNTDMIYNYRTARKITDYLRRERNLSQDIVFNNSNSDLIANLRKISIASYRYLFEDNNETGRVCRALQLQENYFFKKIKNCISFDQEIMLENSDLNILDIIKQLVIQNPILNSGLCVINNELYFKEFSCESLPAIPVISTDDFDTGIVEYITETFKELVFYSRQYGGRMALFAVLLCNKKAKVICVIDHCIADASSISLIKLKISNLIHDIPSQNSLQYFDYCEFIHKKNATMKGVLSSWYIKQLDKCAIQDKGFIQQKLSIFVEKIPKNENSIGISLFLSYLVAVRISKKVENEFISVRTQFNLREYAEYDFSETLGDMHVSVALVFQRNDTFTVFKERSIKIISLYTKDFFRPSYLAKNRNIEDKEGQLVLARIGARADIVSINYLGMYGKKELDEFLSNVDQMQKNLIESLSKRIYVTAASNDKNLFVCMNIDI